MKLKIKYIPLMVFYLLTYVLSYGQEDFILNYLPDNNEIDQFVAASEFELYVGDELFYLINGGADLFQEYGFNQAAVADYMDNQSNTLHIEIFEMADYKAAYGIYSVQHLFDEEPDQIGEEGQIINNNAFFVKGRYVIRITAKTDEDNLKPLLTDAADLVSDKIKNQERKNILITQLLPVSGNEFPEMRYLRGNIALSNIYNFHYKDIFDFDEGIAGIFEDYYIFILRYPGKLKATQQFNIAKSILQKEEKYHSFFEKKNYFQVIDRQDRKVIVNTYEQFNIIFVYGDSMNVSPLLSEIKENIGLYFRR